jgi:hypothetical protein
MIEEELEKYKKEIQDCWEELETATTWYEIKYISDRLTNALKEYGELRRENGILHDD